MGLFAKKESLNVVECLNLQKTNILCKHNISAKSKIDKDTVLNVLKNQAAVIVFKGVVADVLEEGRYTFNKEDFPKLYELVTKQKQEENLKVQIYFINNKSFAGKWGTCFNTIAGFGTFNYKIFDINLFMKNCFGINAIYTVKDLEVKLKPIIATNLIASIATLKRSENADFDFAKLTKQTMALSKEKFEKLGLKLTKVTIENLKKV